MIIKKFLAFSLGLVVGISSTMAIAAEPEVTLQMLTEEVVNIGRFLNDKVCPFLNNLNARVSALEAKPARAPASIGSSR